MGGRPPGPPGRLDPPRATGGGGRGGIWGDKGSPPKGGGSPPDRPSQIRGGPGGRPKGAHLRVVGGAIFRGGGGLEFSGGGSCGDFHRDPISTPVWVLKEFPPPGKPLRGPTRGSQAKKKKGVGGQQATTTNRWGTNKGGARDQGQGGLTRDGGRRGQWVLGRGGGGKGAGGGGDGNGGEVVGHGRAGAGGGGGGTGPGKGPGGPGGDPPGAGGNKSRVAAG